MLLKMGPVVNSTQRQQQQQQQHLPDAANAARKTTACSFYLFPASCPHQAARATNRLQAAAAAAAAISLNRYNCCESLADM